MRTPLALALFATSVSALHAQPPATPAAQTPAWDVTQARGTTRDIDFTTSEGTWMSVDISPDGAWIVFDLLGHIYRMPATGGEATALTQNSGVALNFHPRISPDGKLIAFVSDRSPDPDRSINADIYVVEARAGAPLRRLTMFDGDDNNSGSKLAWSPDGKSIAYVLGASAAMTIYDQ